MIVCHCKAVTDRTIRLAVRGGARSRAEIQNACSANLCCGGCASAIDEIIASETNRECAKEFGGFPEFAVVS
jgi:bacterioferritin-associated ferredoxin